MPEEYGGPFLQMAVLCERVLQEKDGVLSLIRIVDRFTISGTDREMPRSPIQVTAAIAFKSGFAQGKYFVKLRPHTPSGKILAEQEFPVLFEGADRGVGIVAQMGLVAEEEGLYWIDVLLQEVVVTRMPLRVLYQRAGPIAPPKSK